MNDRTKLIFLSILVLWLFWGEAIIFMFIKLELGILIFIFVTFGLGLILTLSSKVDGNFFKLFSYFKAKQKGKKYYGYIYQILEDDTNDPNAANTISKTLKLSDIDADSPKEFIEVLKKLSGNLALQIVLYDDIEHKTTFIEQKVRVGELIEFTRNNQQLPCKQYTHVYKYKGKIYMKLSDIIPKFVVPKNHRSEIKNKVEEIGVYGGGR